MADLLSTDVKDADLLLLTDSKITAELKAALAEFWLPPHQVQIKVQDVIAKAIGHPMRQVIVSGETQNISLYCMNHEGVFVYTPHSVVQANIVLREVYSGLELSGDRNWCILPISEALVRRLTLPKVLLINPCEIEHFPIPRLSLNVGLLAGYLRKHQKADVRIIDMQIGPSVDDVIQEAIKINPNVLGLSVSYGQKKLALAILERIYEAKKSKLIDPLIVLGNIIPASFPGEFIELHPDIIIALNEGESAILDLIGYINGEIGLKEVRGIAYRDVTGNFQCTPKTSVPMTDIPLPSLDTLEGIAKYKGALTLEISRGCQWNACTFCPREHKSNHWKTFSTRQVLEQMGQLRDVCNQFGLSKHIFLADEEFIGGMNDGMETERVSEIARGLKDLGMKFDAAARVDQVYSPQMGESWHTARMEMWHLCRKAGLDRLFMGIESGSDPQLQRYGKGIRAEHSIIAIRILSALGIPLRFGFITFDQLMVGLDDLKDNVAFLERTDAFIKPIDVDKYGYEKLFELLTYDRGFVADHSLGRPVYAGISYMLATMEVLINSRYKYLLKNAERQYNKPLIIDEKHPDTNMGRYKVDFVDDLIRDLSVSCQRWIDRNFGVSYTIKSLYKVAQEGEKPHLMSWMVTYRRLSLLLLKTLIYLFESSCDEEQAFGIFRQNVKNDFISLRVQDLKQGMASNSNYNRLDVIAECMGIFELCIGEENDKLNNLAAAKVIRDAEGGRLSKVIRKWKENIGVWRLINELF